MGTVRRNLTKLACLAALALPAVASAQSVGGYQVSIRNQAFTPLGTGSTNLPVTGDAGITTQQLPFPVVYFGNSYSQIHVNANGWASFTYNSNSHYPTNFPNNSAPNGVIAAFWADMTCDAGQVKAQTMGTTPNRNYVVEWNCPEWSGDGRVHMQLWLTEGSPSIEVRYGSASGVWDEGAMGIESPNGDMRLYGVNCGITCQASHVPVGKAIVYSREADLSVGTIDVPARAYGGVELPIEAQIRNLGGKDANSFDVNFYLSSNGTLELANDRLLGTANVPGPLTAGSDTLLSVPHLIVPPDVAAGNYFVLVHVDPANAIIEDTKGNNLGVSAAVVVEIPTADLLVEAIALPTDPQLDGNLRFSWTMRNRGAAAAVDLPYVIVASYNDYNSNYDVTLASGTASIAALVALDIDEVVTLPGDLLAGAYHIGVILDPDNVLFESDETNNLLLSTERVLLGTNTVVAATLEFPEANVGSNYCVLLEGAGGDGSYVWTLVSGELPPGLALEEERAGADLAVPPLATLLCGRPNKVGTYEFTLEVTSAGISSQRDFELTVAPASGMPLTPATLVLHDAIAYEDYRAQLNAVGGTPPFEWSVVSGALPAGIKLDKSGRVHGVPTEAGEKSFVVSVKDSAGSEETATLSLTVASPTRLTCMTKTLPSVEVGTGFGEVVSLHVAGGAAPYIWTTVESRRLPTPIDSGETYTGKEPPGLTLSSNGEVRGTPEKAGRYLWMVEVQGSNSVIKDTCAITFDVTYSQGITITTTTLVDAYAGVPYEAMLSAVGGGQNLEWSVLEGSSLPGELDLDANGMITGVLPLSLLEGRASKVFPFQVLVRDAQNRIGVASLSIRLFEKKPEPPATNGGTGTGNDDDGGGCQAAGGDLGLLAFGAALGLASLRRRRA